MIRQSLCGLILLLVVGLLLSGCDWQPTIILNLPDAATARPTVQPTVSPDATTRVKLFFIALDDNGNSGKPVGCGDSVVFGERDIPKSASVLKDTLTVLFSAKEEYYGTSRLYNALFRSDLSVAGISNHEGVFKVDLTGQLVLTGVCEDARIRAQIMETIMQFPTVKQANVFVNGVSLDKLLSG
jgi:Sporulation and spore germination